MEKKENNSTLDIRNLSAPIITVISIIGFFMWITFVGTNERYKFKEEISSETSLKYADLKKQIHTLEKALDKSLNNQERIIRSLINTNNKLSIVSLNSWTKSDHVLWCDIVRRKNKLECPDYSELKGYGLIPTSNFRVQQEHDSSIKELLTPKVDTPQDSMDRSLRTLEDMD